MAFKVAIKFGQGSSPLIVLKHPELCWRLECVHLGEGVLHMMYDHMEILHVSPETALPVSNGEALPKGVRSLQLFAQGVPQAFSAHLIGVAEDAVPAD